MRERVTAEESDDAVTKAIERRRRAIEAEWNELGAVVLIGAGEPIPIPGRADRVYPFLAHSEYFYLTDHQRPGAVLAYDPQEGWSEFVPAISADERLWSGALSDEAGTGVFELEDVGVAVLDDEGGAGQPGEVGELVGEAALDQ